MDVTNTLRKVSKAKTLASLWRLMVLHSRSYGFQSVSYYLLKSGIHQPAMAPVFYGFSDELVAAYLSQDYNRLDLAPRIALAHGVPMRWSDIWRGADATEAEFGFLEALRAAGVTDGFALPCFGPGGRDANVGLSGMTDATRCNDEALHELHAVAQAAHLRICALTSEQLRMEKQLSQRELQILDWVARGKSNGVIADILHISVGTVDTYMRRIYEKMDVSDRTSAAVKGVGMGLISA